MRVLVIGAGMYVTGRDGTGVGTILSSLAESSRTIEIEKVTVVARSESNRVTVDEATNRNLELFSGSHIVHPFPDWSFNPAKTNWKKFFGDFVLNTFNLYKF